jgi:dihydrofolate reductase
MIVSLIVAVSENNVIGAGNKIPWIQSEDLKHFRKLTVGKVVLMGRKTLESIGHKLADRDNWILSSQPVPSGCRRFASISKAIDTAKSENVRELCVIGGKRVYEEATAFVDVIYLTRIHAEVEGDVTLELPLAHFRIVEETRHEADEKNMFAYSFITMKR